MKIKVEEERQLRNKICKTSIYKRRKYNKISHTEKIELLNKYLFKNKSIKQASIDLNINYSSAKKIMSNYRLKNKQKHNKEIKKEY